MRDDRAKARLPAQGRLAQLVEHLVYTERVGGSSPSAPTRKTRKAAGCVQSAQLQDACVHAPLARPDSARAVGTPGEPAQNHLRIIPDF
jgi:hypothetical protein